MSNMSKHVVIGAGQVGRPLAELLAARGHEVVVVSRSGSGPDDVKKVAADISDRARLTEIAQGAAAIYNAAGPPYHRWPTDWPPLAEAVLAAAEASGAVLVSLGNLYAYGPVDGAMTEDLPMAGAGAKARVRSGMWTDMLAAHRAGRVRATELRSSDYFGPGATGQTPLGTRFVPPLLAGRPASYLGDPEVPHSWTYLPDVAAAAAAAATDERAWGRAWHVPTGPAISARAFAERLCALAEAPAPRIRTLPGWLFLAAGTVSPLLRALRETRYQFDRPFVVDSSAFQDTFGVRPTGLDAAIEATIGHYRRLGSG